MSIRNLVILLAALIALLVCLSLFAGFEASRFSGPSSATAQLKTAPSYPPAITPQEKAQLAASKGFQVLVSYTDRGFEPATVTVKKGDTVRFTNNSSENLWVASVGTPAGTVYSAGSSTECGQSAFDSCSTLARGDFWEFTFTEVGSWGYQNNRDTKTTGVIIVE